MSRKGFSLVELMIAVLVFLMAIVGVLYSYLKCMELAELGRNSSIAIQAVKNKVEDIKNSNFATISATFNNTTFDALDLNNNRLLNGKGVVYVNSANPTLLQIKVVFSWKQQSGRLIGEDTNLNGALNGGEDRNSNGQLDSYVQVVTNIYG